MELFYVLLVLLVVTRLCAEIAQRFQQPPLAGELIGGILLGGLIAAFPEQLPTLAGLEDEPVFHAITDLAIFFLMLLAGIELQPREIARASGRAFWVAVAGFFLPLAIGLGIGWAFLPESPLKFPQALFIGTAMAITAIPVAVKALMEIGKLNSNAGRMIISAAIFDDVLSLLLLALLLALIRTGGLPPATELVMLGVKIVGFFAIAIIFGLFVMPRLGRLLLRAKVEEFELSALLATALALSLLAESLELHFILGAFLAGLFFSRRNTNKRVYDDVAKKISGLTSGFLAPIFFASIGLSLEPSAVVHIPLFLTLLVLAAYFGKLLGAGGTARLLGMNRRDSLLVGAAMSGRGAVELVLAGIALRAGLFDSPTPTPAIVDNLFSAVVIVAIVTTLAMPITLRAIAGK
ncbi:MAG: cation:proton antiporter [Sphingomonadales bacterium]